MRPARVHRYCRRKSASKSDSSFFKRGSQDSFFGAPENSSFFSLQRKEQGAVSSSGKSVSNYVSSLKGKGQSLPGGAKQFFSSRMGYDFSNVKVHTDKSAAESAKELNAKAYTVGNNIVFNEGQYNTETGEGTMLMAHELSHVIQQDKNKRRDTIDRATSFSGATKKDINLSQKYLEAVKNGTTSAHVGLTVPFLNGQNLIGTASPLAVPTEKDVRTIQKDAKYISSFKTLPANNVTYEKHIPDKPGGKSWSVTASANDFAHIINNKCTGKDVNVLITGYKSNQAIIDSVNTHEDAHVAQLRASYNTFIAAFDTQLSNLTISATTAEKSKELLLGAVQGAARAAYLNFVNSFNKAAADFHGKPAGVNASFSAVTVDPGCQWIKSTVTI